MLSLVLHGARDLRLETREIPRPQPGCALVRIHRTGICGSDLHYFEDGRVGSFVATHPFVLGHEGAGEVVEVAADVGALRPGTSVVIDPSQPCGHCRHCRSGRYNLCAGMRFLGSASVTPHIDGLFREYVTMPARNCHPLPEGMSYAAAALVEPMTIALHALKRGGAISGASVLVMGGGTIGLLVVAMARVMGAAAVAVSELRADRRDLATALGANATFDPKEPSTGAALAGFAENGFDLVFEASGAAAALSQAIVMARRGGTVVVVGSPPPQAELPANAIMAKELQVLGSFRSANVFDEAIRLAHSGASQLSALVTHVLPPSAAAEAMQMASTGNAVKVQLVW